MEAEEPAVPLGGISLEARLRDAREKREQVLAEKALRKADGDSGQERRGNFEFGPAPFDRAKVSKTDGLPFVGAAPREVEPDATNGAGGPVVGVPVGTAAFSHYERRPAEPEFHTRARPRPPHFSNPKIAEGTSAPAETTDSSRWGLDPDDDIIINPKIVESMLPFTPYQVSGDEDPWFSASAKAKLKAMQPKLARLDPSAFIPVGEDFNLGTPGELKAVFDEVKYVHARQRRKIRLVRVLAIIALIVAVIMVFPIIKGGFQPALESILLSGLP